jgi:hypothetical protein
MDFMNRIKETIKNEYLYDDEHITDFEVGNPIDGAGTPQRVFVTYKEEGGNREYHRTFYATITGDGFILEEYEDACFDAGCWCLDEDEEEQGSR